MAMMYSENASRALDFLQKNPTTDLTAPELADQLGITAQQMNGTFTGLVRKGLGVRVESEVDGKTVKFLRLTDAGMAVDPFAEKPEE